MSSELLLLAGGAALAGLVQGISGFAFAMVAMSVWVWGVEPRLAAVMAVFGGLVGQLLTLFTVPRRMRLGVLAPYLLGALAGVPLGVGLLPYLDPSSFKLVLGTLLVLCCPAMLLADRVPRLSAGGRWADGAVGIAGGTLGGIAGFSGVLPSLWCTLRGYDKDLQRCIVQNFNLAALAVTMVVLLGTGAVSREMLPLFVLVAPAMALPSLLGARLHLGLSEVASRRIVLGLLTASGVAMIAASLPRLLSR